MCVSRSVHVFKCMSACPRACVFVHVYVCVCVCVCELVFEKRGRGLERRLSTVSQTGG